MAEISDETSAPASGGNPQLAASAYASLGLSKSSFTDLVPDTEYLFAVVKSGSAGDIFAPENLLYIDQKTADYTGKLTFTYEMREEYEGAEVKLFGAVKTSIADAVVTAPKLPYTGKLQFPSITVTLNGKTLTKDTDYSLTGNTEAIAPGVYSFTVVGIGDYKGSAEGSFEITATEIKLNVSDITMLTGTSFKPTVWRYPSESTDKVTYTSSNKKAATVSEDGTITAVAKGKAVITAKAESGKTATVKVNVVATAGKPTTSIVINKSSCTLTMLRSKMNPTVSLSAKISGSSTGKLFYSDNINVATVTASGKVTAVGEGTANIYCRTADGKTSKPCVVKVGTFRIDSDDMRNNIVYVNAGDETFLDLTSTYSHGAVTWKSSNAKTAAISSNGKVKALKKGTVTITVTAADKTKDTVKLTVVSPSAGVTLKNKSASVYVGKSVSLKASLTTKGSNDPVFWSSSDPTIAKVDAKGKVTGVRQGKVTITATTFNGKTATATVTVRTQAKALEFTQVTQALYANGSTGKFTVKISNPSSSNDTVTWTTSNKKAASIVNISADGKTVIIKSGAKGTSTITAKSGSGKKISCKFTCVAKPATDVKLNTYSADIYVGKSTVLKVKSMLPKGCGDVVLWKSLDPNIATVDENGKVTGKAPGTVVIQANTFGGCKNSVKVTVRGKATSIAVDKTSLKLNVKGSETVNVKTMLPTGCNDKITWTTSSKSTVKVTPSSDGRSAEISGIKKGTATVTVKTGSGKSAKIKVTVTP